MIVDIDCNFLGETVQLNVANGFHQTFLYKEIFLKMTKLIFIFDINIIKNIYNTKGINLSKTKYSIKSKQVPIQLLNQ